MINAVASTAVQVGRVSNGTLNTSIMGAVIPCLWHPACYCLHHAEPNPIVFAPPGPTITPDELQGL